MDAVASLSANRPISAGSAPRRTGLASENDFRAVFEKESIHFSHHAQDRMKRRDIVLSASDMRRIEGGLEKAASKGAQDALFLLDDLALIVNVPNRTVVTSIDQARRKENIFTKIDSTVIL